ncbi:MAG: PAS domain S-box protein [Ilumatobacteraceae bacterium]
MSDGFSDGGEAACSASTFAGAGEPDDAALARVVRELADAVVVVDADGVIVVWNSAATALFGWTALEAAGKTLELIVPTRLWARHAAGFARVMATGHTDYGSRLLEVPALRKDGTTMSIAFTVTLLRHPEHRLPHGIAAVIRDDTENREAKRALHHRRVTD